MNILVYEYIRYLTTNEMKAEAFVCVLKHLWPNFLTSWPKKKDKVDK